MPKRGSKGKRSKKKLGFEAGDIIPGGKEGTPFFPGHMVDEVAVLLMFIGFLVIISTLFIPSSFFEPALSEEQIEVIESPADPFETPDGILPEWYFLSVFELLKVIPVWLAGLVLPVIFLMIWAIVPFLDKSNMRHPSERPTFTIMGVLFIYYFLLYTTMGAGVIFTTHPEYDAAGNVLPGSFAVLATICIVIPFAIGAGLLFALGKILKVRKERRRRRREMYA